MSYRFHPKPGHWRTELCIVAEGVTQPLRVPDKYKDHSAEDCRLFIYQGKPHASVTISRTRVNGQAVDPCVQIVGELDWGKKEWTLKNWRQPQYGKNDMTGTEKNWVFGQYQDKLVFTYAAFPHHIVCQMGEGNTVTTSWRTESPKCPFGVYRGGTQTFDFHGKRLRFCHVVQNNPKAKLYWHYYLAAYVFEPQPPFKILQVSQHPIVSGNEAYVENCPHQKANVIIPYGAVKNGSGWSVACGRSDHECVLVNLQEEDLNL